MLHCPECESKNTRVIESRTTYENRKEVIRRRRLCADCRFRWSTLELRKDFKNTDPVK